ncbi:MAG: acetyltransferase [Anaerolineae bacterium]|nr:acetyltransferase [Anaerolineae bacterium]
MSGTLILGAGGHGKVVADILICQGVSVLGFLDDNPATWGSSCLGLPILGGIDAYQDYAPDGLIIGIGQNQLRKSLVQRLDSAAGTLWINAIHPSAIIAPSVCLGSGIVIAAGAVVNPEASIGDHSIINTGATVDHDCQIGNFCHIAPGVHLAGAVTLGEGSFLGIGSAVIPLRSIGDWTLVGAGAVVVRDVPSNVTAKGIPARWDEE